MTACVEVRTTPLTPAAGRRRQRQQRDQLLAVGLQSAAGLPEVCGRIPHRESRSHRQDRAVRLGRLLDEADHRVRVRHRAGRVHRPPVRSTRSSPSRDSWCALDDLIKQDNVDLTQYAKGLADVWKGNDGKQYGLPKDFDTIGIFYNKDMAAPPASPQEQLDTMEWNPTDGGTYEETIAKLTVDANGVHGDQPGFDKTNVKTYGLGLAGSGGGDWADRVQHVHRQQRTGPQQTNCGPPSTTTTIPSSRRPSPGGGR